MSGMPYDGCGTDTNRQRRRGQISLHRLQSRFYDQIQKNAADNCGTILEKGFDCRFNNIVGGRFDLVLLFEMNTNNGNKREIK